MIAGGPRGGGGGYAQRGPLALSAPPQKVKDFRGTLRRLADSLRPDARWIGLAIVLTAVGISLTILGPRILARATNLIFEGVVGKSLPQGVSKAHVVALLRSRGQHQMADMLNAMNVRPGVGVDFTAVATVLALAVLVYVLGAAFSWMQGYIMAGVAQRTVYRLRERVQAKLDRLPLAYYDSHERGDVLSRVTNDIDNISTSLQQTLGQLLTSVLTVVGVLAMMVSIDFALAGVSLVVIPLSAGITILIARRSQRRFVEQWKWTGRLNAHVEQMHTGHALVQAFGYRDRSFDEFERLNDRVYAATFRAQFLSGIIQPAMQLVGNLNYVAIAVVGGYKVASGTLSLGDVQAFIQYSRQFTMPIMQLASQMNLIQSGVASAERVFELLDAEEEVADPRSPEVAPTIRGRVEFDHVAFRYLPERPLIEDFSLLVEPGQTIAIVGPTGAGKTTIVNLLMRFYDVDSGAIRVDGIDIRGLPRAQLRRNFGMVLQDTWLFADSIRANIAYGRLGATDDEVVTAAEAAHFDGFVRSLPDGYSTVLDDDVSNISAGQRQLLTIARAFIANPSVLILDEATSNVDTRTEVLIQQAMARLRKGRTSFVIAHRLSTIRSADRILVMDHGRIVEQGSHDELLAREGFYHNLYRSQFAGAFAEV